MDKNTAVCPIKRVSFVGGVFNRLFRRWNKLFAKKGIFTCDGAELHMFWFVDVVGCRFLQQ